MQKPKKRHVPSSTTPPRPGEIARAKGQALSSYRIDALPIINQLLHHAARQFLQVVSPTRRSPLRIAPALGISLLLETYYLSREPLYGVKEEK